MTHATYTKASLIADLRSTLKDYAANPNSPTREHLKRRIQNLQKELDIPFDEAELN